MGGEEDLAALADDIQAGRDAIAVPEELVEERREPPGRNLLAQLRKYAPNGRPFPGHANSPDLF